MKIAVVGSRNFPNKQLVFENIRENFSGTDILISGGARGVDTWAEETIKAINEYRQSEGMNTFDTIIYKADWDLYGNGAGFMRNEKIINEADLVLAFWDGESKGTKHSIDLAIKNNKPINIYIRR